MYQFVILNNQIHIQILTLLPTYFFFFFFYYFSIICKASEPFHFHLWYSHINVPGEKACKYAFAMRTLYHVRVRCGSGGPAVVNMEVFSCVM